MAPLVGGGGQACVVYWVREIQYYTDIVMMGGEGGIRD